MGGTLGGIDALWEVWDLVRGESGKKRSMQW